jgi:hypothetical protein
VISRRPGGGRAAAWRWRVPAQPPVVHGGAQACRSPSECARLPPPRGGYPPGDVFPPDSLGPGAGSARGGVRGPISIRPSGRAGARRGMETLRRLVWPGARSSRQQERQAWPLRRIACSSRWRARFPGGLSEGSAALQRDHGPSARARASHNSPGSDRGCPAWPGAASPTRHQQASTSSGLNPFAARRQRSPCGAIAGSRPLAGHRVSIIVSSRNWRGGARYCAEGNCACLLHLRATLILGIESGRTDRLA